MQYIRIDIWKDCMEEKSPFLILLFFFIFLVLDAFMGWGFVRPGTSIQHNFFFALSFFELDNF